MNLEPPTFADGRYTLVQPIGTGGMATVFRARDNSLAVERAIKVLHTQNADQASLRTRFVQEAQTMALLRHPHIVAIHDIGTVGASAYLVMELMDGGSLMERVRALGPLPPRMAAQAVISILDALAFAHAEGVIHRDIKPHNVLLDRFGVAKLSDFGIAHRADRGPLTRSGAVMGTFAYMAPEQRKSAKEVDHRADLYSTGATLFVLLTGEEPFDLHNTEVQNELLAEVPAPLVEPIRRATRYRPEDRFGSAVEMKAALEQAAAELPPDPPDTPALAASRAIAPVAMDARELSFTLDRIGASAPATPRHTASPAIRLGIAAIVLVALLIPTVGGLMMLWAWPRPTVEPPPEPAEVLIPAVDEPIAPVTDAPTEPAPEPAPPRKTAPRKTTPVEIVAEPLPVAIVPVPPTTEPEVAPVTTEPEAPRPVTTARIWVGSRPANGVRVFVDDAPVAPNTTASVPIGARRIRWEYLGQIHEATIVLKEGDYPRQCWDFNLGAPCPSD